MPQRSLIDDRLETSTSQKATPPQSWLANILERVLCDDFGNWNFPEEGCGERRIEKFLGYVHSDVRCVLVNNPNLNRHLADNEDFLANVKRRGMQGFINSAFCHGFQRLTEGYGRKRYLGGII